MKTIRREAIRRFSKIIFGFTGFSTIIATGDEIDNKTNDSSLPDYQDVPLFSGYKSLGNLVFISGRGARLEGGIKEHTENVLNVIEGELKKAGSSMEKVLKVSVYLNDMNDFQGMNEVYSGRFGKNPPVRTTVAVPGGLPPADAFIQMDCIAYI